MNKILVILLLLFPCLIWSQLTPSKAKEVMEENNLIYTDQIMSRYDVPTTVCGKNQTRGHEPPKQIENLVANDNNLSSSALLNLEVGSTLDLSIIGKGSHIIRRGDMLSCVIDSIYGGKGCSQYRDKYLSSCLDCEQGYDWQQSYSQRIQSGQYAGKTAVSFDLIPKCEGDIVEVITYYDTPPPYLGRIDSIRWIDSIYIRDSINIIDSLNVIDSTQIDTSIVSIFEKCLLTKMLKQKNIEGTGAYQFGRSFLNGQSSPIRGSFLEARYRIYDDSLCLNLHSWDPFLRLYQPNSGISFAQHNGFRNTTEYFPIGIELGLGRTWEWIIGKRLTVRVQPGIGLQFQSLKYREDLELATYNLAVDDPFYEYSPNNFDIFGELAASINWYAKDWLVIFAGSRAQYKALRSELDLAYLQIGGRVRFQ